MEGYDLLSTAVVSGIIPINKYRSKETGFTVCIANVDGPLVNGYFTLATEAHDDDGLPHTLEHLIFMGSEIYPYKGMLDLFANRCLAQGTNAWTDVDHTCYTMTTAGSEGFLNLLPIYLDHVLYPTLTESAYVTEVHHVNGDGEDAGVVYCEMQARENTHYSRTHLEFVRSMYPGKCGYKSETGGIMKNLRESCSHKKVCKYHADFYRPDNLCLIITGNIKAEDVFRVIRPFEEKIKSKGPLPPYTRPWMSTVPQLEKEVEEKHVMFSTDDESTGMVLIGWRGSAVLDYYTTEALKTLFKYLTDTPVAPLQKELVEIEDPLCGDIGFNFFQNKETAVCLHAENVPKENLFQIKEKVYNVLKKIASGDEAIDMDRLITLLHRSILEEMNALEDNPHDTLALLSIGDFLFSDKHNQLQEYVDKIKRLQKLKSENESFWTSLLNKYIIGQKMVVIVGDPSEDLMKKMGAEEKERVQKQAESFGDAGLKQKKEALEKAVEENLVEPSVEIVNELEVPSTDSIVFHDVKSASNRSQANTSEEFKKFTIDGFPCAFHVYHVKSLFTQIFVVVDTSSLHDELRMYLPLYTEILFESPILKDGKVISYEDVVKQLAADTLSTDASIGIEGGRFYPGAFSKLLVLSFKLENEKYVQGVHWVKDVLFNLQFSTERLKSVSNKMINDVANYKRNGRHVVSVLLQDINFTKESNFYICNVVRQHAFLTQLLIDLETSPDKILSDMEALRNSLLTPEHFRFYVAANLNSLPANRHELWKNLFFKNMNSSLDKIKVVPNDGAFSSKQLKTKAVGIGSVETAFLIQTCPGVDSYEHPDYPAMLVFIEYLCALEGPLWRQIRGCGLSYNYRMQASPSVGTVTFILAKSTHVFNAYKKAKEIVEDFVSGKTPFEYGQVEAARSGTVFQTIEREETIRDAVIQNILSEFKRINANFSRSLLKKVSQVTIDDLKRVGQTYFAKLFDTSATSAALCCHPTKVEEITKSFDSIGVKFEILSTLEEEFLK